MRDHYLTYTHESYLSLSDIMVTDEKITCTLQADYCGLGYIHPSCGSSTGDLLKGTPANPTVLDLPLWMVQKLSGKQQVIPQLPKAFQEEARRILSADPGVVDLRREASGKGGWRFSGNYYALGLYILRLISPVNTKDRTDIQKSLTHVQLIGYDVLVVNSAVNALGSHKNTKILKFRFYFTRFCIKMLTGGSYKGVAATALTILQTFTHRFRKIFDWSNSTHRDILAHYTSKLDRSEVQLLRIGKDEQSASSRWLERKSKMLKASSLVKNGKSRPSSILSDQSLAKRARV